MRRRTSGQAHLALLAQHDAARGRIALRRDCDRMRRRVQLVRIGLGLEAYPVWCYRPSQCDYETDLLAPQLAFLR